ncbi:valine--tRNA ligase [Leptospira gomenensis]|uniref:Valine--tRNA ligase n=1 Tax=Leptospira gomenensis TaxID=2484974 RepID=A0A5F1YDW2_9LEPT|nr:valine--tRNA ligase [Leptospira gomenensis]TGK36464.1 valine--tRNA ligase [Leptospira gomenensis]TGK38293.1 valine--tRNA ligase [Leptospira gomenensis]TGK46034.1 valine--tRNA ligase [Leptospira gomenensis]TGK65298.1 valine--tRNA ligase [Leptospira gomenensis]
MKKQIGDRYEPKEVESKWISLWEEKKSFLPNENSEEIFSIVIPPPNVTGSLHIGHALNHTIQDILIRIERKKGKSTLWLPGMDHAGIATQMVVERELAKEGKKRTDFTRQQFEQKVWEWKEHSGGTIVKQQRLLGESVDWTRERFTFDEGLSKAVFKVFKSLYDEGLIYRGERIINWCPASQTAISDLEVEFRETKGKLYHIKYPIHGQKDRYAVVATTRPETMLGDVAVCANPDDERYASLKNVVLDLPLTDRRIPLLFDSFVDKEFGSGLVKITPAHDANDFEAGQRLGLKPLLVMNPDGTMNENAGAYEGLDRFEARKKVVADLEAKGLIEKIEDHVHAVGHNSRGGAVIEPYLSTQWFVKIRPLADLAVKAVRTGQVEFVPKMWEKTFFEWMNNIRDWCISRQLWWGHKIPAYHCKTCKHIEVSETDVSTCPSCGSKEVEPDPDVLDTWFSSQLWPFSSMGWPEQTADLKRYYPTSVLVTGFDIIFFWVSRMIMMGMKFMEAPPFHKVLIHGLVRDKDGKKFSKSIGNVIDPLVMMEKYGTDSFRFFLAATLPEGKDILFDESRLDGYRSFCNKIWNSSRFILMNLEEDFVPTGITTEIENDLEPMDEWILSRFNHCLEEYNKAHSKFHFYEMTSAIYEFVWGDFCDWYIELVKPRAYGKVTERSAEVAKQVLVDVLTRALGLLHPFMPFLTEEVHSVFSDRFLAVTPYPESYPISKDSPGVQKLNLLQEIVTKIRVLRAENGVTPDKKCKAIIKSSDELGSAAIRENEVSLLQLARLESVNIEPTYEIQKTDSVSHFSKGEVVLPLAGLIDVAKEKARLEKELQKAEVEREKLEAKLANPGFLSKAAPDVIEKEREKLKTFLDKVEVLKKGIQNLAG